METLRFDPSVRVMNDMTYDEVSCKIRCQRCGGVHNAHWDKQRVTAWRMDRHLNVDRAIHLVLKTFLGNPFTVRYWVPSLTVSWVRLQIKDLSHIYHIFSVPPENAAKSEEKDPPTPPNAKNMSSNAKWVRHWATRNSSSAQRLIFPHDSSWFSSHLPSVIFHSS